MLTNYSKPSLYRDANRSRRKATEDELMRITLCGSARFEATIHEWNEKLSLAGHVVYALAVYPSSKGGAKDWYTPAQKEMLDSVHLDKIANSEAIVVVNVDGYTGESTQREIAFARANKKAIYWVFINTADKIYAGNLLR